MTRAADGRGFCLHGCDELVTVLFLIRGSCCVQGHGRRRATCRCAQDTELFVVDIKDFQRILRPLQQGSLRAKIAFLKEVGPATTNSFMAVYHCLDAAGLHVATAGWTLMTSKGVEYIAMLSLASSFHCWVAIAALGWVPMTLKGPGLVTMPCFTSSFHC